VSATLRERAHHPLPPDGVFFATFAATGHLEDVGETAEGYRLNFLVDGGRVCGPGIDAAIQPGGGDWMRVRTDGVAVLDIRATFRTTGGALVHYRAGGMLDLGPDGYARAVSHQLRGTPTFYVAPTFQTADPELRWLNRVQGFGVGRALLAQARVEYDVYLPRPSETPGA
jgi:hypothetical protein